VAQLVNVFSPPRRKSLPTQHRSYSENKKTARDRKQSRVASAKAPRPQPVVSAHMRSPPTAGNGHDQKGRAKCAKKERRMQDVVPSKLKKAAKPVTVPHSGPGLTALFLKTVAGVV